MSTNIIATGQPELDVLKRVVDFLEQMALKDPKDPRMKCYQKFYGKFMKQGQDHVKYKLVQNQYAKELEEGLVKAGVPYMAFSDGYGNTAFLMMDEDHEKFLEIFMENAKHHAEFYRENTPDEMLRMENNRGISHIMKLEFDNEYDFNAFRNKAFSNGQGYVLATEMINGKYIAYASAKDCFTEDAFKEDIPSTLLRMDADRVGPNVAIKHDQIDYDNMVEASIINRLRNGEDIAIVDRVNNKSDYFECKNGQIHFFEYSEELQGFQESRLPIDIPTGKAWDDEKTVAAFSASLSINLANVKNMTILSPEESNQFFAKTVSEIEKEKKELQEKIIKAYYGNGDKSQIDCRPYLEPKFAKEYLARIKENLKDFEDPNKELSLTKTKLQVHIEQNKTKVQKAKTDLEYTNAMKESILTAGKQLEERKSSLKEKLSGLQGEAMITTDMNKLQGISAEINEIQSQIVAIDNQLANIPGNIEALDKKIREYSVIINEYEDIKNTMENRIQMLENNYTELKQIQSSLRYSSGYRELQDKAIQSVKEQAHKDVINQVRYKSATVAEKEEMMEAAILNCLKSHSTKETKTFYEFLEKNGTQKDYEDLINIVENDFQKQNMYEIHKEQNSRNKEKEQEEKARETEREKE